MAYPGHITINGQGNVSHMYINVVIESLNKHFIEERLIDMNYGFTIGDLKEDLKIQMDRKWRDANVRIRVLDKRGAEVQGLNDKSSFEPPEDGENPSMLNKMFFDQSRVGQSAYPD